MQQQAAIMAATHGGYITPSVAFPATQIHQMGALNINSLPPTPMTPVSGLSSPPANITTSAVPSIVTPIVNGFTGIPHQPNGHPAVETVYTNGLPPYSTQSPTAADTLQQAFTGVQQYTGGDTTRLLCRRLISPAHKCQPCYRLQVNYHGGVYSASEHDIRAPLIRHVTPV
uniref:Uncharacterized protein n=1 Tax=Poecilia mexicana TaxID=48701 RepID=A0A3B3X461_9TELE